MSLMEYKVLEINEKDELKQKPMSKTARWMFNRLQLGRKDADELIANIRDEIITKNQKAGTDINKQVATETAVDNVFNLAMEKPLRELQYIINEKGEIVNVASNKHTLIKPKIIEEVVLDVLEENNIELTDQWDKYNGVLATRKEADTFFGKVKIGLSIGYGNTNLTKAIRVGAYYEIGVCTNPLTFLELKYCKFFDIIKLSPHRVLRIGNDDQVLTRFKNQLNLAIKQYNDDSVPEYIEANGMIPLETKDAFALTKAMCNAYSIGQKIEDEICNSYEKTKGSVWDLAMIMSKISRDEDNFRKNAVRTPAKLSAMALVILTFNNIDIAVKNSYEYCKQHTIAI